MPLRGSNTEAGLLIESPPLAHQVRNLIKGDGNEGIYRLRLAADGETIEWVSRGSDGKEHGLTEEPDNDRLTRLKLWLIGPLAPEELL